MPRRYNFGLFPVCDRCDEPNAPDARVCRKCRMPFASAIEVAENSVLTPTADELRRMSYRQCLEWCAGRDGKLRRQPLTLIARAKHYNSYWVQQCVGKDWKMVLERAQEHQRWRGCYARERS